MFSLKRLLAVFFPLRCQYCGKVVEYGTLMCTDCLNRVVPECYVTKIMTDKKIEITVVSPFLYKKEVRKAILRFKFAGKTELSRHFAECMKKAVEDNYAGLNFDFVTAVPLSKGTLKERGYNQAEILARDLAKMLNLPYIEVLEKVKENKKQRTLTKKERIENVKGVYEVFVPDLVAGKRILICDDIVTTGSTLKECAQMLVDAGINGVYACTTAKAAWK